MLLPDYLDSLPDPVLKLYRQVEEDILEDMARRISKMEAVTATANWQRWRLEQIQLTRSDITAQLSKLTGLAQQELSKMFREAATKSMQADDEIYRAAGLSPGSPNDSPELVQLLNGGMKQTSGSFQNLSRTTANTATQQFERALDRAWLQISSGAFDYQTAIRRAIKDLAGAGLQAIQYPTGHTDALDVAVRRAVLTGVNQTAAKLSEARAEEMGCDLVETTAHPGARPDHVRWQGKVFSRSGKSRNYPDFVRSTGYGTGPGLCGWNCRHSFFPYFEGLSESAYPRSKLKEHEEKTVQYNGKTLSYYDATQQQRYIERQIRRWKREYCMMEAAGQDTTQAGVKLTQWRDRERDFCKQTGLDRDSFRSQTEGFGRSQAAKARAQAKRAIAKSKQSAILNDIQLEPLAVTAQSVQSVRRFPCDTLSPQMQARLQNEHKRLLMFVSGKPAGTEAAATYTLDVKQINRVLGDDGLGKIRIPREDVPYIAAHTHPTGGTFTHTDLLLFARDGNMMMLTAVGNNGVVYAVEKTADFDYNDFLAYYEKILSGYPKTKDYFNLNTSKGTLSPELQTEFVNEYVSFIDDLLGGIDKHGILYHTSTA